MLALDAEDGAGAAVLVADLGDHRRHAGVVGLEVLLRPREVVADREAVAHLRRVALAEDLALHVHVHLAPGVGLRARLDVAARGATVARLFDGGNHGREGLVGVGGVARLDEQILAVLVHEGLLLGRGLRHGGGRQDGGGEEGGELVQGTLLIGSQRDIR